MTYSKTGPSKFWLVLVFILKKAENIGHCFSCLTFYVADAVSGIWRFKTFGRPHKHRLECGEIEVCRLHRSKQRYLIESVHILSQLFESCTKCGSSRSVVLGRRFPRILRLSRQEELCTTNKPVFKQIYPARIFLWSAVNQSLQMG